ncbi:hypothetical protein D7Z26_11815 [Cohnella endophytica]|uniref:Uncharacterized protein n=1 Tax=Cohnella endophytica TaxID=2419778 RepID=A0A494XU20_9BACL|nr:hypothetical protein [Cohnella endophytica]RKP54070.1 hypothetical protein D7Z26_11815 [Cohnella endophytica]
MDDEIKPLVKSVVLELFEVWKRDADRQRPKPKVLYIFCDSTAHEAYTDHFIHLRNHGVCHDILFLDGETSGWLGMHKLECGGAGRILAADEFAPAPLEVPGDYDGIVIPEIDLDNAARVALGMKGTIKAEIVFASLVQGKFVLVGEDSPGLKRSDRRTLKTISLPQPFVHLFSYYKQELRMYGVELAPQKRLAELVVERLVSSRKRSEMVETVAMAEPHPQTETDNPVRSDADNDPSRLAFEGKLVSAQWVSDKLKGIVPTFGELVVSKKTIVSPLARDMLKDRGITIRYADEGGV